MNRFSSAAAAIVAGACLACASQPSPQTDTGDFSLTTSVKSAISGGTTIPVAAVWVHLWGTSTKGQPLDQWYKLAAGATGQYSLTISKIAAGSYLAHGKAFSLATALVTDVADYESVGDVGVLVVSKATATVTLTLQQNTTRWPPDAVTNAAPIVDSLVAATNAVDSNGPVPPAVTLRATASDPDGPADLAAFQWAASYAPPLAAGVAPGTFSTPTALQTSWTPPVGYEGTVTFSFTATDRRLASSTVSMALAVSKRFGNGSAGVTVEINNWPDILSLTAADGQLTPGAATSFDAVAKDPDGDDLRYQWDDGGCGGSFGTPTAPATTYQAGPSEGACAINLTVTDVRPIAPFDARGGRTTSRVTINVRSVAATFAPEFVFAAQSGSPDSAVAPGTVLSFLVEAVQAIDGTPPTSAPVTTFRWSDGLGGAFVPLGGNPGQVTWAAPACALLSPPYRVDVVVEALGLPSSGGLVTPLTFPVLVACP